MIHRFPVKKEIPPRTDTDKIRAKGDTHLNAFENLRHALSLKYGWPESEIYWRSRNNMHYVYHKTHEFRFRVLKNVRTNEWTLKICDDTKTK